jgi:hypothetical protein
MAGQGGLIKQRIDESCPRSSALLARSNEHDKEDHKDSDSRQSDAEQPPGRRVVDEEVAARIFAAEVRREPLDQALHQGPFDPAGAAELYATVVRPAPEEHEANDKIPGERDQRSNRL